MGLFPPIASQWVSLPQALSDCGWCSGTLQCPLSFEPCSEGWGWLHPQFTRLAKQTVQDAFWICFLMRLLQRSSNNFPIVTLTLFWLFSTLKPANLLKMKIWSCHSSVKPVNGFPFPLGQSLTWPIRFFMIPAQPSPPASFQATLLSPSIVQELCLWAPSQLWISHSRLFPSLPLILSHPAFHLALSTPFLSFLWKVLPDWLQ